MAGRVTKHASDDTHLADHRKQRENMASSSSGTENTSVDAHHAGYAFTDTTIALVSYNLGINNNEVPSSNSCKWTSKWKRLRNDIASAFKHEIGVQVVLISEFGNMFESIDNVFEQSKGGVTQPTGHKVKCTRELFEDR